MKKNELRDITLSTLMLLTGWLLFGYLCPAVEAEETTVIKLAPLVETVEPERYESPYTAFDVEMLACVIYQEAGGDACSDETRLMVGCVVMNRIESNEFPATMEEVLTAKNQYGRFYWTGIVWPDRAQLQQEQEAVARSYECAKRVLEGERVLDSAYIWQAEFKQGSDEIYRDGLYFGK